MIFILVTGNMIPFHNNLFPSHHNLGFLVITQLLEYERITFVIKFSAWHESYSIGVVYLHYLWLKRNEENV